MLNGFRQKHLRSSWRGRKLLAITSLAITFVIAPQVLQSQTPGPGPAYLTICNEGNTDLYIARVTNAVTGGFISDDWVAEGWVIVEPEGWNSHCKNLARIEEGFIFDTWGLDGTYYFTFMINGKNGKGPIRYPVDFGFWGSSYYEEVDREFCVDITKNFELFASDASSFEDLDDCPSGYVMVPFSIAVFVPYYGTKNYDLTIDADRSAEVELIRPPK